MKKIVEKVDSVKDYLDEVKDNKSKRIKLFIILVLVCVPIFLVWTKCGMEAMLCMMVNQFDFKFFLNVIAASILLLVQVVILKILSYLD